MTPEDAQAASSPDPSNGVRPEEQAFSLNLINQDIFIHEEIRRIDTVVGLSCTMSNLEKNCRDSQRLARFMKPNSFEEVPKFETVDEFQDYFKISILERRVTFDQCLFISKNYAEKRAQLADNIQNLTDDLWSKVPELNKRLDYANYVNFLITYTEMFHWIGTVMETEYQNGIHSFIPCQLIDIFHDYFETVQKAHNNGIADISNFSFLLYIRDRIVDALRDHFSIVTPMRQKKKIVEPPQEISDRYNPFDYEWLSGTVVSGKYHFPFMKFLAIDRMQQLELSYYRAVIVASKRKEELGFLKNLRIPFPQSADNANLLDKALQTNETKLRQDFCRILKILKKERGLDKTRAVLYIQKMEQFNELCGVVRNKKKSTMDQITHCEPFNIKPKLRFIAVMASIDALLLVIQRVYALFVDKEKGIYGECVPESVLLTAAQLLKITTVERCRNDDMDKEISGKLEVLRVKVHNAVKNFYIKKESINHGVFVEPDHDEAALKKIRFELTISENEFPPIVMHHASRMLWHLRQQKKELKRLNKEIHFAKAAELLWPKIDGVMFQLNKVPGICAFVSNFDDHVDREKVKEVIAASELDWMNPEPEFRAGVEIINGIHHIMDKYRGVPHCVEIRATLEAEFHAEMHFQRINGQTYKQLAAQFSQILIQEIDLTNSRIRYQTKMQTAYLAHRIARMMAGTYMDYVCNNMKNPPSRCRVRTPTPIPEDDLPEDTAEGSEEGRESEETGSETGSDYATDEGPNVGRRRVRRNVELESDDDDEDEEEDEEEEDGVERQFDPEEAARVAFLLNTFSMNGNVIFVENEGDVEDDRVPDDVIDNFIRNVRRVHMEPDMSAPYLNIPLD